MTQDISSPWPVEARRHRRYRIPSRTYLGYAIGVLEGLLAIVLALVSVRAFSEPNASLLDVASTVGGFYGIVCAVASAQFLQSLATRRPTVLRSIVIWLTGGGLALAGLLWLSHATNLMPDWTLLALGGTMLVAVRMAFMLGSVHLMRDGRFQIERVALIGSAIGLAQFGRNAQIWRQGAQVVRSLALDDTRSTSPHERLAAFAQDCVEANCDTVLLVGSLDDETTFDSLVAPFRSYALNVMRAPTAGSERQMLVDLLPIGAVQPARVLAKPIDDTGRLLKRSFDIVATLCGLVLLLPFLLLIAVLIKLDSRGPVLFVQERRGFNGKTFRIFKFRSMSVMEDGRAMRQAQHDDPRITRIGAFLRRSSIDELPQLLNVLRGEMSLVGPRPHAISHDDELALRFGQYAQRQRISPGITGW
ncbi:MAG TPA: sugar transferase, partial [Devosia sp.]|nr:sugar transferase [Devosia sp.]